MSDRLLIRNIVWQSKNLNRFLFLRCWDLSSLKLKFLIIKSITNHIKTHIKISCFCPSRKYFEDYVHFLSKYLKEKGKLTSLLGLYAHLKDSSSSKCQQPCDGRLIKIPFNMQSLCLLLSTADRHWINPDICFLNPSDVLQKTHNGSEGKRQSYSPPTEKHRKTAETSREKMDSERA